ncbi:hypothetical protein Tco_0830897 [Tanacetum coccineum]
MWSLLQEIPNTLYPTSPNTAYRPVSRLYKYKSLKSVLGINHAYDQHLTYHETPSDRGNIDDPNITMEEYTRLEEEKARRRGKVYNLETAMYGKIWYDEDVHDLRSVETEFPAIVFNDTLMSEPTISSLNKEIDFKISFYESDDEDYTPRVSYFNDLDFLKDFEKEFPATVYDDALTSK